MFDVIEVLDILDSSVPEHRVVLEFDNFSYEIVAFADSDDFDEGCNELVLCDCTFRRDFDEFYTVTELCVDVDKLVSVIVE